MSSESVSWARTHSERLVFEYVERDLVPDEARADVDRRLEADEPVRALETILETRRRTASNS